MKTSSYKLSVAFQKVLLAVSRASVDLPQSLNREQIEERFLKHASHTFLQMQKLNRMILKIIYWFFERMPLFFGLGFSKFSKLKLDDQKRYLSYWLNHRFAIFRDMVKAVRGVVMVIYFSDADIWAYLDYQPLQHVEERIRIREELLKNSVVK